MYTYYHVHTHTHTHTHAHTRMHTHYPTHTRTQKSWIQVIVASGVLLEPQPPTHIDGEGGRKEGKERHVPIF